MRLPLDCRANVAVALYVFPCAVDPASAHGPPEHPFTYPTKTRPSRSILLSKKSSRLRTMSAPPPLKRPLRCIGKLGVTSDVVQCAPPSKVCATYRCHRPVNAPEFESPVPEF